MFTYMYNIIIHIHIFTYGLPADWRLAFWRQSPFCQVVILPIYIYRYTVANLLVAILPCNYITCRQFAGRPVYKCYMYIS